MTTSLSRPDEVREFYQQPTVADTYLELRTMQPVGRVLHEAQVAFVNRVIARLRPARVLELAPGPGRLTAEVRGHFRGVAVERSGPMLGHARRRVDGTGEARWQFIHGDAFALPLGDGTFDLAYTIRFIRHFRFVDRRSLYREIHRVLAPNGAFVLEAQNRVVCLPHRTKRGLHKYPVYDELYTEDELLRELEAHGFVIEERQSILKHYELQMQLNRLRFLRLGGPARLLIQALEHLDGPPNTWMLLCRKR
jgi:ubiquinone/menaquinone biosynthesis C-methylase UbiE